MNGVFKTGSSASGALYVPQSSALYVGGTAAGTNLWNGTIDEVMIFNRSLSADEITALYETSAKKLLASGTQAVAAKMSVSIVLSNPAGQTEFDEVTVTSGGNDIRMIVPYDGIDINGTLRAGRGQQQVEILNMGVNATSNRQVVQVRAA
jgi:hypothetical protein